MNEITIARGETLSRGQLSATTGCNIETIRYYEKIGVMPQPRRTAGGHRLYGREAQKRLSFICHSRSLGFNLEQVRGLLEMADSDDLSCREVRELTSMHLCDVQEKISDLKRLERVLEKMIADCAGDNMPECPIIDALYKG